jgi:hypothetical protein
MTTKNHSCLGDVKSSPPLARYNPIKKATIKISTSAETFKIIPANHFNPSLSFSQSSFIIVCSMKDVLNNLPKKQIQTSITGKARFKSLEFFLVL